jgi:hypothetical protein
MTEEEAAERELQTRRIHASRATLSADSQWGSASNTVFDATTGARGEKTFKPLAQAGANDRKLASVRLRIGATGRSHISASDGLRVDSRLSCYSVNWDNSCMGSNSSTGSKSGGGGGGNVAPILRQSHIWVSRGLCSGVRRVNLLKQGDSIWDRLEQLRIRAGVYDSTDVLRGDASPGKRLHSQNLRSSCPRRANAHNSCSFVNNHMLNMNIDRTKRAFRSSRK